VRNWDIFIICLLRPVADALPPGPGFEGLIGATERARRAALDQAKQAVVSKRYTESMLLFDKDRVRTFVKCLTSLRDDLGYANDVRVAYYLVDQIGEATNHDARAINRAEGIVMGWHERVLAYRNPGLRKHVRRFRRLDPFW
jgi:CHAD domain-containing protein